MTSAYGIKNTELANYIFSSFEEKPDWVLENPYLDILAPRFFANSRTPDWSELPQRVGRLFLRAEQRYSSYEVAESRAKEIIRLVSEGSFLPNSPVMMNSEFEQGANLFACHVLSPPSDASDLDTAKTIHDGCGGIGYDFSRIADPVSATLSIERETKLLNPNRKRKAHSAVTLDWTHAEILEFVQAASQLEITHVNVELDDKFFEGLLNGDSKALLLWDTISKSIYETGRPSLSFSGAKEKRSSDKLINNVCGESLLRENESSLIGSLNLTKFVRDKKFDFERFREVARLGLRLLDNLHDIQDHASAIVRERCLESRKVGVGVMGYSDALLMLNLRYGSDESLEFVEKLMSTLKATLLDESERLGNERGFCNLKLLGDDSSPRRNVSLMAIPANGTLSLIANVSGGIEPVFTYLTRQTVQGVVVEQLQPTFKYLLGEHGIDSSLVFDELASGASLSSLNKIDERLKEVLIVANELTTEEHIFTQAKFQHFIDGGISKTINLPSEATVDDIKSAIMLSKEYGCVGVSLYRNQSVENQPTQAVR